METHLNGEALYESSPFDILRTLDADSLQSIVFNVPFDKKYMTSFLITLVICTAIGSDTVALFTKLLEHCGILHKKRNENTKLYVPFSVK